MSPFNDLAGNMPKKVRPSGMVGRQSPALWGLYGVNRLQCVGAELVPLLRVCKDAVQQR